MARSFAMPAKQQKGKGAPTRRKRNAERKRLAKLAELQRGT